jgi:low affinity Fe/Cu permease
MVSPTPPNQLPAVGLRPASSAGQAGRWERLASGVTLFAGSNWGFGGAAALVLGWLLCGPLVGYTEAWQLVINTSTTIITFLMVFLIQRSQNKEAKAVQLKLNEIVAALDGASNRMISIEDLGEKELDALGQQFRALLASTRRGRQPRRAASIEEVEGNGEAAPAAARAKRG